MRQTVGEIERLSRVDVGNVAGARAEPVRCLILPGMDVSNRPGYLTDLPGELALYGIGIAGALTVYGAVPGVWSRPASAALAVAAGIAAVRWLGPPRTPRRLLRYAAVGLVGLAAVAAVIGFVTDDPSAVGWIVSGVCLVALSVLISVPRAAVGSLLIAPIFVAAGVLVVAVAIAPLSDVQPMPKAFAIFGAAVAIAARTMVREDLGGLPTMMLAVGAAFLVAGVILLPDRTLGLAPSAAWWRASRSRALAPSCCTRPERGVDCGRAAGPWSTAPRTAEVRCRTGDRLADAGRLPGPRTPIRSSACVYEPARVDRPNDAVNAACWCC